MSKTIALKIFIDVAMLVLYVQLMFFYDVNPLYHEVAGIAVGALCLVHLGLNGKSTRSLARAKTPRRRIQLILDIALLALMAATVITGLLIAKELFLGPCGLAISTLHTTVSWACLATIGAHLLQHAKYLKSVFTKRKQRPAYQYNPARRDFLKGSVALGACAFTLATSAALTMLRPEQVIYAEDTSLQVSDAPTPETPALPAREGETPEPTQETPANAAIYCTACKKRCPLSALQCQKGVSWAQQNGYL